MQETLLLYKIVWLVTPVLVSIVGWFIVRNVNRIERDIDRNDKRLDQIDSRLSRLEGEHTAHHK